MTRIITHTLETVQEVVLQLWGRIPELWRQVLIGTSIGIFIAFLMNKNIYYGVVLAILIGGLSVLLFEPAVIIYAVVLLVPVNWLTIFGERLKATTVLALPAFAYALFLVLHRRKRVGEPLVWAYIALVVSFFISMLNAADVGWSLTSIKVPIFSYLFAFAMLVFIDTKKKLKVVLGILIAHGIWLSILAVFQSFGGAPFFPLVRLGIISEGVLFFYKEAELYRASGTFETGPRFALFLLMPFSLVLARAIDLKRTVSARMLWTLATVIIAIGLLLSLTRAVFIIVPIIAYLIYKKAGRSTDLFKIALSIVAISTVITILLFWALPPSAWEALKRRFAPSGSAYYMDRLYFMYLALMAFLENPLTGVGLGNFVFHSWNLMQKYPAFWYHPEIWDIEPLAFMPNVPVHNSYFRMLAETSIWGLVALIAIIVLAFRNYSSALKKLKDDPLYSSACAMFACFVGMVIYWFPHEYFIEETYISIIPVVTSAVLKRIADNYADLTKSPSSG